MVFDRSAIKVGRTIQDFGLGDLNGVYLNTAKLRAKGLLVVFFFNPAEATSGKIADLLQTWTESLPAGKVSIVGVGVGDRGLVGEFAKSHSLTYPIVWDYDEYVASTWALAGIPTTFVTNAGGKVLARITGSDLAEFGEAHTLLSELIRKADEAAKAAAEAKAAADAAAKPAPVAAAAK